MGNMKQKSRKFIYRTTVSWTEEKKGFLCSSGKPTIEVSTPPEFRGHEGIWTPEDLFVASVNACIMTTFLHYTEKEGIEFLSYKSEGEGILERVDNTFMISEIKIKPRILVKQENDIQRVKNIIELCEKNCLISNSIKSMVEVIPEISI